MKHSMVVVFDSLLRAAWHSKECYPLSTALHKSAQWGTRIHSVQRGLF